MADGWSIDPSDVSISSDGTVTFPANTRSDKHYTVYYRQGEHCGKYSFTQKGSGGGGGDCTTAWNKNDNAKTVIEDAENCTGDKDATLNYNLHYNTNNGYLEGADGTIDASYKKADSTTGITVVIINNLDYYVPVSATKFRLNGLYVYGRGLTSCKLTVGGIEYTGGYFFYGSNFETNFLIPPHHTMKITGCTQIQTASTTTRSCFGFNVLKSSEGDHYLHTEDSETNPTNWGWNNEGRYDSNTKTYTFTVNAPTGTNWWYGERHYAFSQAEAERGYVQFTYGSSGAIVATNIAKINNGTWDLDTAIANYPYEITQNS